MSTNNQELTKQRMIDEKFIKQCFELALQFRGRTTPNPIVGSVITKNNKVISTGAHKKSGSAHAELDAIQNATESLSGATLYCNLEPCCHINKKTPPCAQRIIEEGIKRVVISNLDPNPEVSGAAVQLLKDNGIEVVTNILKSEGEELNRVFFYHIQSPTPYIHLKWAQTLDGKIQSVSGSSKWITNEQARAHVHHERMEYDAIMIGANTARADNPALTVRDESGVVIKSPKRIVLCGSGEIDQNLSLFNDSYKNETIIVTNNDQLTLDSSELMLCPTEPNGRIDLNKLLVSLKERGICSIYIEGGSQLLSQLIESDLYNEISVYMAPKLMGNGSGAFFQSENLEMPNAKALTLTKTRMFEDNILMNFRNFKNFGK